MRWPFRRDKDTATVPQEIQEYYQSERRERTGIAWLLALGTLLVTIALAILLFFAGRWLYRTVANRDDNKPGQTTEQAAQDQPAQTSPDTNETTTPAPSPDNGAANAPAPGSQPAPAQTPATGTSNSDTSGLPNTGPGDVIGIFAVTTIAGAVAHRAIYGRRFES